MAEEKKINLAEVTVYTINGVDIRVQSATLAKIEEVTPIFEELQKMEENNNLKEQIDIYSKLVYLLVKDDNAAIDQDFIKKNLTMKGCTQIVQSALGAMAGVV